MTDRLQFDRRQFLAGSAAGALVLGLQLPTGNRAARAAVSSAATGEGAAFNAWLRIGADDTITILVGQSEMGQGIYTALPMLLAEELECDWSKVTVAAAPAAPPYRNIYLVKEMLSNGHADPEPGFSGGVKDWLYGTMAGLFGQQVTGGSTSVRGAFEPLRRAGAQARQMLIAAAAAEWAVPAGDCSAKDGRISHAKSGKSATYGALAAAAAKLEPPKDPALKPHAAWRLLGKPLPRLDIPSKVNGTATFGIDIRLPGMLFAMMRSAPVFGGKVASFDAAKVTGMAGVKAVVPVANGVAVVADNSWRARQALEALPVTWNEGPDAGLDTAKIKALFTAALTETGSKAFHLGDAEPALAGAAKRLEAEYAVPFLAHATMEPMNCTAWVKADGVEVWAPTQAQEGAQDIAAKVAGVGKDKVQIHTTFLGGGFGRRAEVDLVEQAVTIAKAVGQPVQLLWSREEDMRHDFYRPAALGHLRAGLDGNGMPVAWTHKIVSPSIMTRVFPAVTWMGPDATSIEGAANLPYAIAHQQIDYVMKNTAVPVGFWRSVGHSQNAFITECFLDEVAAAGAKDPVALRRALLDGQPRFLAVLELAAAKSGWGSPLPPRHGRGVAIHQSFGSIVAEVAEVEVKPDGAILVHRVTCAVDCGTVINPDTVEAQVQGSVVFGLTAALHGRITIDKGRVSEGNFDTYEMVRLAGMPKIAVHVVPSQALPGGVGEIGVPPIAPALVNAIFAATGKRVRSLPLKTVDLRQA